MPDQNGREQLPAPMVQRKGSLVVINLAPGHPLGADAVVLETPNWRAAREIRVTLNEYLASRLDEGAEDMCKHYNTIVDTIVAMIDYMNNLGGDDDSRTGDADGVADGTGRGSDGE